MPFLVPTYLGMWGQRKTPNILQVTVIRTLCSDLNTKRELIWCKGRKQWFLVSCKGQPDSVSLPFSLDQYTICWFTSKQTFGKLRHLFFKGRPEKPFFQAGKTLVTSLEQENKLRFSVFIDDCPHVLSWRKFNRKTGGHKETNKT